MLTFSSQRRGFMGHGTLLAIESRQSVANILQTNPDSRQVFSLCVLFSARRD